MTFPRLVLALAFLLLAPSASAQGGHAMGDGSSVPWTAEAFERLCMTPMEEAGPAPSNLSMMDVGMLCMAPIPPGMENASDAELERVFLQRMIPHHEGAVRTAQLVPARTAVPELLDLAENITRTQTNETETMTRWLREWHGASPPNGTIADHLMQQELARMANLTSEDFEQAFLDHMTMHHEMAVNMSQPLLDRDVHPEMRAMANDIVQSQRREIEDMTAWRGSGYPSDRAAESTTPTEEGSATPAPSLAWLACGIAAAALLAKRRR